MLFDRSASKSAIDWPSTPAAPWLALTLLYASQTSRFGMSNGFALSMRFLPLPVDLCPELNNATPSLQPHYRAFVTTTGCSCAPHRYSDPRRGLLLGCLPSHRGDRFPRSAQEPAPESRHLHAGCHLGSNQAIPQTDPGLTTSPRF